ncbi:uncharacterized protein LOC111185114 isoform X2 [Delphinapterus leucas]|uniref:Uncharacterized protein LOC111185114 isoform X2 n=1 Tax=Delphinapterus leucas TaxID=9749 RepID=A0A2Y9PX58_DELLE|nr:uncharacterized protein LOC111185114 isoform X2 [Delphinapterus leucas]
MRSRRREAQRLGPEKCRGRRGRSPLGRSDAPPPRLRPGAWGWRLPAGSGCEDSSSWAAVLGCHGEVLRARASPQGRLETLERWCREELPTAIEGRAEKHVTRDEPEQLLAWKLARGRFRPRLQQLLTANSPELVVQRSAAAFRLLPDVNAAVTELCALRGVGPAITSLLAARALEVAASMSEKAVAAVPGLPALQYTLKHYLLYLGRVQERATALSQGAISGLWTPHRVETALWIWAVGQKLCPDLLPDLGPSLATPEDTRPAKKHRTQAY